MQQRKGLEAGKEGAAGRKRLKRESGKLEEESNTKARATGGKRGQQKREKCVHIYTAME